MTQKEPLTHPTLYLPKGMQMENLLQEGKLSMFALPCMDSVRRAGTNLVNLCVGLLCSWWPSKNLFATYLLFLILPVNCLLSL